MSLYLKAVPGGDSNFSAHAFFIAVVLAVPVGFGFDVRRQAGSVRQQFAHGHQLPAVASEFGKVSPHRGVQFHLPALDQQHHGGRGGDDFCQRRHVENRALGHRFALRHECAIAVCLVIRRAVALQPQHAAGTLVAGDGRFNRRVHRRQLVRVENFVRNLRRGTAGDEKERNTKQAFASHG